MGLFSRKQLKILVILAGCNFMAAIVYSLQAPFYPAEAERQGASTTFAGLVLGIYEFAGFIACPLISCTILPRFGSYLSFHLGLFTTGTTTLLFGFLNRLTDATTFISLSLVLRILEASGAATTFVSCYGFLNAVFPDSIGTAFAVMETMFAVGMAVGPPLGEAIYELGGGDEVWSFTLPFLTMGLVMYTAFTCTSFILWPMRNLTSDKDKEGASPAVRRDSKNGGVVFTPNEISEGGRKEGFIGFLQIPSIFVFYITIMVGSVCLGFITCTLEPFTRQFNLTHLQTGGMFLIFGGVYAVTASIWGMICDRIKRPIFVTLIGCLLSILAFMFMGPCTLIPLQSSVQLTAVSLAAFGLGVGGIYVSGFLLMLQEAKRQGFPDTSTLSGAISALWLSGMHLGSFIGPILGGALFEKYGFGVETLFLVILCGVILILLLFVLCLNPSSPPSKNVHNSNDPEKTALLQEASVPVYGT